MSENSQRHRLVRLPINRAVEPSARKHFSNGTKLPMVGHPLNTTTCCIFRAFPPDLSVRLLTLRETDCLDIVPVRVQYERPVVSRTILRPRTGAAVVATAGLHRRCIEFAHGRATLRQNRDMRVAGRGAFAVPDPDSLAIGSREPRVLLLVVAEHERVSERLERRLIEAETLLEIRHPETDVIDHLRCSELLRIAQLQQLLAEVCAREQPDDCLRRVLEALLQIDLVLEFALGVPLRHLGNRLGIALEKMKHEETFHPRAVQYQVEIILRPDRIPLAKVVVLRDRTAQHDPRPERQPRQCMIEDLAADIVEVHVDALRTMLAQRSADVLTLIVNRGAEA